MTETPEARKPNFKNGFPIRDFGDRSMVSGQADGEEVVLARRGDEFFAIGAHCSHYGGPLADGLIAGDTLRCPWHHACFSLRTGEPVRAPALDSVSCWRVEKVGDKIFVRKKVSPPAPERVADRPSSVVIVGGGGAGLAAADMLRREGYEGPLTIVSADDSHQWIALIFPKTTWQARLRRSGFLCGLLTTIAIARLIFSCTREFHRLIQEKSRY